MPSKNATPATRLLLLVSCLLLGAVADASSSIDGKEEESFARARKTLLRGERRNADVAIRHPFSPAAFRNDKPRRTVAQSRNIPPSRDSNHPVSPYAPDDDSRYSTTTATTTTTTTLKKWKWPPVPPVKEGITFSRAIEKLPPRSSFYLTFEGDHCGSADAHGDNDCHYQWGETVEGSYVANVTAELTDEDSLVGSFKIDKVVPYEFKCKVCGEDCILHVPVLDVEHSIKMPPCPIAAHTLTHAVHEHIRPSSPTDGKVRTGLEGTVQVVKGDEVLVEVSITAFVK